MDNLTAPIGIAIGGAISNVVVRRWMPGANDFISTTTTKRHYAFQIVAAIYLILTSICLAIAAFVGGTELLIGSAVNFALAVAAVVRTGLPHGYLQLADQAFRRR